MIVTLRDGSQSRSFAFQPERQKWQKGKPPGLFVIGCGTGLSEPVFDKVFVKCFPLDKPPAAHDLLRKLEGVETRGTPKVLGYARDKRSHFYFVENLNSKLLDKCLNSNHIICPEILRAVVSTAQNAFEAFLQRGYVYIDFCTRNIMIDRANMRIAIIDIDSSWPIEFLKDQTPGNDKFAAEFWGLWEEHVNKNRLANAPKSVVLSFAAVWSLAIALKHPSSQHDPYAARELVLSPVYSQQRALWEALSRQNRQGFLDYFRLSGANAEVVYNQWQRLFEDLQRGRELPWEELTGATGATGSLLNAIEEAQKPQPKPSRRAAAATRQAPPPDPTVQTGQGGINAPALAVMASSQLQGGSAVVAPTPGPAATAKRAQNQVISDVMDFIVGFGYGVINPFGVFKRWNK